MGAAIVIVVVIVGLWVIIVATAEQPFAGGKPGEKIGYGCAFSFVGTIIVFVWLLIHAFDIVRFVRDSLH
jgi:hypothetical protein